PADRPRREEYADQTRGPGVSPAGPPVAQEGLFSTKGRDDPQAEPGVSSDGVRAVRRQARLAAIAYGQLYAISGSRRVLPGVTRRRRRCPHHADPERRLPPDHEAV